MTHLCREFVRKCQNSECGVYHLLTGIEEQTEFRVYACKEDLEARAIRTSEKVIVPDDFYAALIEDTMEYCRHTYTF